MTAKCLTICIFIYCQISNVKSGKILKNFYLLVFNIYDNTLGWIFCRIFIQLTYMPNGYSHFKKKYVQNLPAEHKVITIWKEWSLHEDK